MKQKTITITCDKVGCTALFETHCDSPEWGRALAMAAGWQVEHYGADHCPKHGSSEFCECPTCHRGFPNVEQFDRHRRERRCGR